MLLMLMFLEFSNRCCCANLWTSCLPDDACADVTYADVTCYVMLLMLISLTLMLLADVANADCTY